MRPSRDVRLLILLHAGISLAGLLIHARLHAPVKSLYFLWASPVSAFSLIVIPLLFWWPATVGWGYLLNAGTVFLGTTGMLYYSLLTLDGPFSLVRLLTESTLPAILILWMKLPIAYVILRKVRVLQEPVRERVCRQ